MSLQFCRLSHLGLAELTESWNRCWRGYYNDMTFTNEQMKFWLYLGRVDPELSLIWLDGDQVIGLSLLARDGEDGWLAGTGIAPERRRQGLFAPLLQAQADLVRASGLKRIYLEVLEQNHARKVYRTVGFKELRRLNLYRVHSEDLAVGGSRGIQGGGPGIRSRIQEVARPGVFRPSNPDDYFAIRALGPFKPAWQRRENYLRRYPVLSAFLNRQGTSGFLFTGEQRNTLLDAWCSKPGEAGYLAAIIMDRTWGEFSLTHQPEDWLAAFFTSCQIKPQAIQYEMCLSY